MVAITPSTIVDAERARDWLWGNTRLNDEDDLGFFLAERDPELLALLASAQKDVQRASHNARRRSAARKRHAERIAEMLLRESEQEIGEITQRGEQVPPELSYRHAGRCGHLSSLREMTFDQWELEELAEEREEGAAGSSDVDIYLDALEEEER